MKGRKKLVTFSDSEPISPKFLMDNVIDTSKTISSQKDRMSLTKGKTTSNYESMGDYLVSILEPTNYERANSKMTMLRPEEHSQRQSIGDPSGPSSSASINSLRAIDQQNSRSRHMNAQLTQMKMVAEENKKRTCRLLFEKHNILQGIVQSQKIQNLKKNFLKKIRRTSTLHPPSEFTLREQQERDGLLDRPGIQVSPIVENVINLLSVLQIITLLVIYSLSFVFQDLLNGDYDLINAIQLFSFGFYFFQIILNLVSVKFSAGRRINVVKQIIEHYMSQNFWIDLISFVIILIDVSTKLKAVSYFRVFIIFKLPQCLQKIQKIEVYFVRNVYNEQYWELVKLFLVNFGYAHLIALCLGGMAQLNPNNSWLNQKGLVGANWGEKYAWSAYWATNIMLTVGFGDISAANPQEAVCLIFIETCSCVIMAFNINRVGSIVNNIRQQDMNRSKKFKIFKKLTDQNVVSQELTFKINNYIQESSKLKKKFNNEEDQWFLKELPQNLRATYLKEANKDILKNLVFFKSLLDRTLCNFSEHLQTKISHPQEIIRSLDDDFNLIILKKGHIGYVCRKNGYSFNDSITDQIRVGDKDLPFLTSLDFITKVRPQYEIKSLQFSVLFTLSYETFINIFRRSDMDYQLFCFLRDKCKNIPDEFEVKRCQFCKNFNHFKFTCPRLHYAPYQQHVVNKYINLQKSGKDKRRKFNRAKVLIYTPMQYYKKVKGYREDLVKGRTRSLEPDGILQSSIGQARRMIQSSCGPSRKGTSVETVWSQRVREVIEEQLIKRERQSQFQDETWIIHLDVMANFNGYFSKDNPKYLQEKFSRETRLAQRKLRRRIRHQSNIQCSEEEILDPDQLQSFTEKYCEIEACLSQ